MGGCLPPKAVSSTGCPDNTSPMLPHLKEDAVERVVRERGVMPSEMVNNLGMRKKIGGQETHDPIIHTVTNS